jgi:SAM-dependent methyltransferase
MEGNMETQLEYGNWIRKKNLLILGLCALGAGLLLLIPFRALYRDLLALLFITLLISFLIPLYAYLLFSQKGGRFQEKLYNLIIQHLEPEMGAKILDIGSGNGVLAVKLAQQYPTLEVVGMDYWGQDWEYSKSVCEKNAHIGGVEARVRFQKGDAAALEFASASFDGAISNLTFHEVRSVTDKRAVLLEALRVVKPGGKFAFIDYFYDKKYYGESAQFETYLKGLGLSQVDCQPLKRKMTLPIFLLHPKILGKVGLIYGKK